MSALLRKPRPAIGSIMQTAISFENEREWARPGSAGLQPSVPRLPDLAYAELAAVIKDSFPKEKLPSMCCYLASAITDKSHLRVGPPISSYLRLSSRCWY